MAILFYLWMEHSLIKHSLELSDQPVAAAAPTTGPQTKDYTLTAN